ncbi:indolepyruvate ferredoxin oxidoreductase family protein [uncultured Methylobacterium sp.]|jgi:indolepyruvate ferredoxin oxidoreductase|uniref:indolepyruvate ferredoxin oxidoreductase family protein n=1 Tax=uncultured Methylobacterium sp. TaxID=157278 RepID=UPI002614C1F2|nr:indolepyruvate ferredoxin oxidoreductase family protein [uncultured Methylobacterium sp.]
MGSRSDAPALRAVSLDDKYDLSRDHVFVTGTQAVIRMLLMQGARDRAAGLDTAGFVSGYRGSPIGGLDQNLVRARKVLDDARIRFEPGLNEELAATAIWGTQQAEMRGEGRHDGVFGLWYGKGPGVDRSGDVFRHANMAGTSRHGGVLALMGDDHTAESSTVAHQSEFHFVDVMSPILNPAGVQEIIDYGLYGYAMSRFCGTWVAFKCIKENIESTASVDTRLDRVKILLPDDFAMPPGGLNIRTPDTILEQEARLQDFKRDAMLAFVRANNLNRIVLSGGRRPRIGVITVGKSYLDVRQAMDDLGLDEVKANDMGLRLYKVACPWPLSRRELVAFADGLDLVMVVEEKRSLIEVQVREELYGTPNQPVCIGKKDEDGNWLFPVKGALDPNDIAVALGERLLRYHRNDDLAGRVARLKGAQARLAATVDIATRTPHFCAGCPHNSSTKVPEGMRAYAGIGCHYMAQWMERGTDGFTQMGGEGANWVGESSFSKRGHVFQNLGDGTYNHSGSLALRWAIHTKTTVTYKILFNDAVAMTGGQPHEGALTVDRIAAQVRAEGVERIALVTDEPDKYPPGMAWPAGLTIHHRSDLDAVQRELAGVPGVSVMIYDQTCASEKRRRRKRNAFPDPDRRVIINELVCEGCGDCSVQSNCVAVQPVETEFGRKRRIDQSSCNKDFSCVDGFCPSFVTVHGAKPRTKPVGLPAAATGGEAPDHGLPEPALPVIDGTFNIIVTGVGGTGVVTVGAILGMAAHLEGKGLGMIDMAGLAQKGGAVFSHVRLANRQDDIHAIRVGAGAADLVLGCDLVVTGSRKVLAAVTPGRTHLVVNTAEVMPGDFTRKPDFSLPAERIKRAVREAAGADRADFADATGLAVALLGNALAANLFMLGYAWQRGQVPLSHGALTKAIELNREAVAMNLAAFAWGRRAAAAPGTMPVLDAPAPAEEAPDLNVVIAKRVAFLTAYQDRAYAERYADAVARLRGREAAVHPGAAPLAEAAARSLFRLMAYKDEYEVARLYTDGSFQAQVERTFEGENLTYEFHLAPPLLARTDPATGRPRKMRFGPWMMRAFGLLARGRILRGTAFDPFGYTHERRGERRLIAEYEALLEEIGRGLTPANHAVAVGLANLPQAIRGYGPVKAKNLAAAKAEEAALLARFRAPEAPVAAAAE